MAKTSLSFPRYFLLVNPQYGESFVETIRHLSLTSRVIIFEPDRGKRARLTLDLFSQVGFKNIFLVGQLQKQQVFSWYEESKSVCLLVDMKSPDPILEDYLAPRGSLSFRLSSPEPLISSPSEQRVGVLLRQWDSFDLTSNCIESLLLQQQVSYTIYLLDDASQDDSGFQLFIHFPQIIIIPLVTRAEYCLSFNILAKYSEFDGCTNIFIVNNDTKDFHRQLLFQLSAALHERDVGIVSPKVLDFDNELVHWKPRRWLGIQFDLATEAYMLRISSWNAVGGFNNSYFRYCEDLRLCFDLRNLGLKQKLVTTVSLQHLGNGSSKKMAFIPVFYFSRNLVWIQKLHYGNTYLLKAVGQAYPRSKDQVSQKIKLFPKHRRLGTLILHLYMCSGLMSGIFSKESINCSSQINQHLLRNRNKFRFLLR